MEKIDAKKIEELLKAGKKEEAKKMLSDFIDVATDENAESQALLDYTMIYMSVMNEIDEAYKAGLEEILGEIKALNKTEKEFDDKFNLAKTRAELGAS